MQIKNFINSWCRKILLCTFPRDLRSCSHISSKVPVKPEWKEVDRSKLPKVLELDKDLIKHLERLSLVNFTDEESVERLSSAIAFADELSLIDVEGIEPMYTVLEDRNLYMRDDEVTEGNCKEEILANASKTFEDYFVSPPGNIPLTIEEEDLLDEINKK